MIQATFDASRDFTVCAGELLAAGRSYGRGDGFDKASVPVRTLKQLYEQRKVVYAGAPLITAVKSDPLVTGAPPEGTTAPRPTAGELERAAALAESMGKPDLLELADGIEGVNRGMNKKAIALLVIRAGRGRDT